MSPATFQGAKSNLFRARESRLQRVCSDVEGSTVSAAKFSFALVLSAREIKLAQREINKRVVVRGGCQKPRRRKRFPEAPNARNWVQRDKCDSGNHLLAENTDKEPECRILSQSTAQ